MLGHAIRNERTDLMSTVLQGEVRGKRNRGRPPVSFVRNIRSISGKKLLEVIRLSQDKERWRQLERTSCVATNTVPGDADRCDRREMIHCKNLFPLSKFQTEKKANRKVHTHVKEKNLKPPWKTSGNKNILTSQLVYIMQSIGRQETIERYNW